MKTLKVKWLRATSICVLILAAFFAVNGMEGKDEKQIKAKNTTSALMLNWEFQPNVSNNPLEPQNYIQASTAHCTGSQEVCGIQAPADENGFPVIAPGSPLEQRIQNKDVTEGDVFLRNN